MAAKAAAATAAAETPPPDPQPEGPLPSHEETSCCSRFVFGWVWRIVWATHKGTMTEEMTPRVLPHLKSEFIVEKVSKLWRAEMGKSAAGMAAADDDDDHPSMKRASIVNPYLQLMGGELRKGVACGLVQGLSSTVFRPIVLNLLISRLAKADVSTGDVIVVCVAFAAVTLSDMWTQTFAKHYIHCDCGSQFVCATSGLILQKACSVRLTAPTEDSNSKPQDAPGSGDTAAAAAAAAEGPARAKTPAEISNLLGNDVLQTQVAFMYLSFVTWGVVGFLGGFVMLVYYIGIAGAVAGMGVNTLMVVVSVRLSGKLKVVQGKTLKASDERMNILAQIIDGMKAVKYFAWSVVRDFLTGGKKVLPFQL
eukprot:SAG22_NODE_321_length_12398_cov_3.218392_3_plen_365_part_00